MMNHDDICQRIQQLYPEAVTTISGADCSFEIVVIAEAFTGMPLLKRQRSIMKLFQDELQHGRWHALTIKTRTPAEQARQA
jgi:acid stress-induced BolA-like protein IbaG/YrbA